MKYLIIFFLAFFVSTNIISQELNTLTQEISELEKNEDQNESLEKITALKRFVDFKYFSAMKNNIISGNLTKNEEELYLLYLNHIPLYHFRKTAFFSEVGDLYMWATKKLILQHKDDLGQLDELQITGMYFEKIKPYIESAILSAGGKWPIPRN